jgi:undecaprenyl-diphosphatase
MRELDLSALWAVYGGGHGAWSLPMLAATLLGEGWSAAALVPLLAWNKTRRFASALAAGIVLQAVLVWAVKAAVGRVRPWIAFGLPTPFGAPHDPSFPSGHAAGSFCVAAFLVLALPAAWPHARSRARAVALLALLLAGLVATSRVYLGVHFPSDVVAGAMLGAVVGAGAAGLYVRKQAGAGAAAEATPA